MYFYTHLVFSRPCISYKMYRRITLYAKWTHKHTCNKSLLLYSIRYIVIWLYQYTCVPRHFFFLELHISRFLNSTQKPDVKGTCGHYTYMVDMARYFLFNAYLYVYMPSNRKCRVRAENHMEPCNYVITVRIEKKGILLSGERALSSIVLVI